MGDVFGTTVRQVLEGLGALPAVAGPGGPSWSGGGGGGGGGGEGPSPRTRTIMIIVLSLVVVFGSIYVMAVGNKDAAQAAAGVLGIVIGYWLR